MKGYFITGTDTDIGKTWTTLALMSKLQRQGMSVVGMKPVAAGCEWLDGAWQNEDARLLRRHASLVLDYPVVNPYAFRSAVSPHVACQDTAIDLPHIVQIANDLGRQADRVLVEGAGGWCSPLDRDCFNADLAVALQWPVILVVGMRLGCINHALLTQQAIESASVPIAGWIAVSLSDSMPSFDDNIDFLRQRIQAPLLGVLPFLASLDVAVLADALAL